MSHELTDTLERDLAELESLRKRIAELESVLAIYANGNHWSRLSVFGGRRIFLCGGFPHGYELAATVLKQHADTGVDKPFPFG